MDDETANLNPPKTLEKKNPRTESSVNSKDCMNWMIYTLFLKYEFEECLTLINKNSRENDFESQFCLFIKALIKRYNGEISDSLDLLRKCYNFNEFNIEYLKEIGKNLELLGRFRMAIEIYDEILERNEDDWDTLHNKGVSQMNLKLFQEAHTSFDKALNLYHNDQTLIQIGKLFILQNEFKLAIDRYLQALELMPENADLLSSIGALYMKLGEFDEAFEYFGNSMMYDSSYSNAVLGIASISQEKGNYEVALIKYKIASFTNPNSPLIWNNLGLCFFAKQKHMAAITSLKKANYLDPFEWIISYNLGLVYLHNSQYASAFHYFNCAMNLKSDVSMIYMYLAITLSQLNDISNSITYYEAALSIDKNPITFLNYTISLAKHDMLASSREKYQEFLSIYKTSKTDEVIAHEKEIKELVKTLNQLLT